MSGAIDIAPRNTHPPGVFASFSIPDPTVAEGMENMTIQITSLDYDKWAWETDGEVFTELWEAILQEQGETLEQVTFENDWLEKGKAFHDGCEVAPWINIDGSPGTHVDGFKIMKTRVPWDVEQELIKFDEDYAFESWYTSSEPLPSGWGGGCPENCTLIPHQKAIQNFNRHLLLSCDSRDNYLPTGINWSGSWREADAREYQNTQGYKTTLKTILARDRFTTPLTIKTKHPEGQGYAKGTCDWGDVYIPENFRDKIPDIGELAMMTIALQDVGGNGKKPNAYRWTAIYNHD